MLGLAARSCGLYKAGETVQSRIIGGQASSPGKYPWVAMLATSGSVQCSAIIVDEYHVLTAGHCLDEYVVRQRAGRTSVGGVEKEREEGVPGGERGRERRKEGRRERGSTTMVLKA